MVNGVVYERYEGPPQGGPLSPLLSNILPDELDQELERRGHKFCRYADDCNIYVRSERSGKRVMETIEGFLWKKLKLKVNRQKRSAVPRPQERQFLGFSFTSNRWLKIKLADKAVKKVKHWIKNITRRFRGISLLQVAKELNAYPRGLFIVLQVDRNAHNHQGVGQLDTPQAALLSDEAVYQEQPLPVPAAEIVWRQRTKRRRYRGFPQGAVGAVERQTAESGIIEPFLY